MIDLAAARETFEGSADFTVGIEEEFALLDPETLQLVPRFEVLRDAAAGDPVLAHVDRRRADLLRDRDPLGRGARTSRTPARARPRRGGGCSRSPARTASRLGATGTHPLSDYREQHIIDTEHYRRVEDGLKYVAWRNNTFSVHVHVGVRGADRAVRVCDRLRPVLPLLLADQRQLALRRRARLRPALRAHADLHQVVPALRDPRRLRLLARRGPSTSSCSSAPARSSSSRSSGGPCARTTPSAPSRCGSATRR